ncbi:oxygenase MpaB family protein [Streptomyces olivaceiscleroticus]|uniref:ER-bound oxygenase mpaB/mpaB'/Rubber oxygenase catalytic domain-containing protein n=1 Tax=Streptomyces olivaceiscleroticus TaxID=68245 RepID=A0ABP3JT02_9ACTN
MESPLTPSRSRLRHLLFSEDRLAKAAVEELHALGRPARYRLDAGLRGGLRSVRDAPPAVTALLEHAEQPQPSPDRELLDRGAGSLPTVNRFWYRIALGLGSLVHSYSTVPIAAALVSNGRLLADSERRIAATWAWYISVMLPGGLLNGADGYVATVRLRLLHARLPQPVTQVGLVRTWLSFTLVLHQALDTLGLGATDDETRDMYRLWWRVGHLLGIESDLYSGIDSHAQACTVLRLVDSVCEGPDAHSRRLTAHEVASVCALIASVTGLPEPVALDLTHTLLRRIHGDVFARGLGIPAGQSDTLVDLVIRHMKRERTWHRQAADEWAQAARRRLDSYRNDTVKWSSHD